MAYHVFFRVGEIALTKPGHSHQILGLQDVNIIINGAQYFINVHLIYSKNDQSGKGADICLHKTGSTVCPVFLLERYLSIRPNCPGPLVCHSKGKPITRYQFTAVLPRALHSAGIVDAARYKSHSFRIGAASEASVHGASNDKIMKLGHWKSNAYKKYIRTDVYNFGYYV